MNKQYSLEFFPPRAAEAWPGFEQAVAELRVLKPAYVSVTFGAGGSVQSGTVDAVQRIREQQGLDTAPHLSCVNTTPESVDALLARYREMGVRRLVVLRGDLPSGAGLPAGPFRYASDLVAHIRKTFGDAFHIEVAAYPEMHPQARDPAADLRNFCTKVAAGADAAITQYFYNADAYFDFCERAAAAGCQVPITPGIMPITNRRQLTRFSNVCGAEIPRWIALRLEQYGDDLASIRAFGLDVVSRLCQTLLDGGAPGLHVYTLNKVEPTVDLFARLGIGAEQSQAQAR